jgi:hypothetical protein
MANPSFVGNETSNFGSGFKALRGELKLASDSLHSGLIAGAFELAAGGNKVKAVWESIKWAAMTRAGVAGFALLVTGIGALTFGIKKAVMESGALQAAMDRLAVSKSLERSFTAFLGSVAAAKARVADLYAFAAHSRFNFEDLANASKALTVLSNGALGSGQDLATLGRIATATSTPIADLATSVGQANNAIRNGFDFSGPMNDLQKMGVISEGTVKQLQAMAVAGASTSQIMDAFSASIKASSERAGEAALSISELEAQASKAQETMMAAFGAPFVERHRKEVELTGKVYQNFTGLAARLGQMLGAITAPFDRVNTTIKEVSSTKGFANLASQIALVGTAMLPVAALWQTVKGMGKLLESTAAAHTAGGFSEVGRVLKGNISPAAKAEDWAVRASRLSKEAPIAARGADLMSKAWRGVSIALEYAVAGFTRLLPLISRLAVPFAAFTVVTILLEKAWEKYNDEVEKARRLSDMSDSIRKDTAAMQERIGAMKTQDDYLQVLADAQNRYNAALEEEARIQADSNMTDDDRHAAEAKSATARKQLSDVERMETSQLGMSKAQTETALERLRIEKQIQNIIFEAQVSRASDAEKVVMLARKRAEYEQQAAEYRKSEAAAPDIARQREIYDKAGGRDEKMAARTKAEVERLQKEYDRARPGPLSPEHVASSTAARREAEAKAMLEDAQDRLAKLSTGPSKEAARANLIAALNRGGTGDRLEALALGEEGLARPDQKKVDALRMEAAKAKLIDAQTAEANAAELRARSLSHMKEMQMTAIDQAAAREALGITSESYGGADAADRLRMRQNRERFAEDTKFYNPATSNEEARTAYQQQLAALNLQNGEIQKGIDERARQRGREARALDTAIAAREDETKALRLASEGHFMEAAMLRRSAQRRVDIQADLDREHELRAAGYTKPEIDARITREQAARENERKAQTARALVTQGREITEAQLQAGQRGFNPGGGATGEAARVQLQSMRDIDTFRAQLEQNVNALGANASDADLKQAALNARNLVTANIMASTPAAGAGSFGDSLTRVGGGGGFYAGVAGDPQLAATKRIADLTQTTNQLLDEIRKNSSGNMMP